MRGRGSFVITSFMIWFVLLHRSSQQTPPNFTSLDIDAVEEGVEEVEEFPTESGMVPTVIGLEGLCMFLNIPAENCSCEADPELCQFQEYEESHKNGTEKVYVRSHTHTMIYAIITLLASAFGTLGNIAVLVVAYKQRRSLTSCKLHIAELALVNLIFSLASIVNVGHLFETNVWFLDVGSCKFIRTLLELCGLLTVGIILIIAIERFCLIVYSVEVEGRFKHIAVGIDTVFVSATVVPYIIGLHIEKGSDRCIEFEGRSHNLSLPYYWFVLVTFSFLPLCIIGVLYGRIVSYISSQASNIDQSSNSVLYMKKMKANRRVMLVALSILAVFLVCTLPTRAIRIYFTMRHSHSDGDFAMNDKDLHLSLVFVGYVTYPFQSTLNPVMYSMVDTEWRKELRNILKHVQIFRINDFMP